MTHRLEKSRIFLSRLFLATFTIAAANLLFLTPSEAQQEGSGEDFYVEEDEAALEEPASMPEAVSLEDARSLAESGELVRGRDAYRSVLAAADLDAEARQIAQAEMEALNMKILFSPTATEDSTLHTVVKGDNLYNLAKDYGTTVELIKNMNDLEGDTIFPGQKLKVSKAKFEMVVDKSDNTLQLLSGGEVLKTYRVATGENNSTPAGEFTITTKLENPTWYKAGAVVPPDSPDNILGTRWLGFSLKGYGIHGTNEPETVGRESSRGCIRLRNEDVEEVYDMLTEGSRVLIR